MGVFDKLKNALFEVEYVEVDEPPKKDKKDKKKDKKEEIQEDKPIAKRIVLPGKREEKEEVFDYTPSSTAYNNPNYSSGNLYGMNSHSSYDVPIHQYGTYEKEEKTYFKPSPIISPIYGILDKNYRKEDVKEKKEIRLTGYTRSNMNVDDIRAKAYGKEKETEPEEDKNIFEVENDAEDNVMVDLSDRSKPEVKELTMGDAEEYFEDLGLEYNVDYVDVSTDRSKIKSEDVIEELGEEPVKLETPVKDVVKNEDIEVISEKETEPDDDNLFDLIDSMYEEN